MTDPVDGGGPSSPSTGVIDGGNPTGSSLAWVADSSRVRDRALALLKLSAPTDAERVGQVADGAVQLCDRYLDRPVQYTADTVPPPVLEAAVLVTREMYMRKDAPFGIYGAWSQDGEALRIARDILAGVEYLLLPYKGGWGLA